MMQIIKAITGGSEESGDVRVTVCPCEGENRVEIVRLPHPRFDAHVRELVQSVLKEENVTGAEVKVQDFGALDFVITARLRATILASGEEQSKC